MRKKLINVTTKECKDIETYWENNADLAESLRSYWGDSSPATMQKVFPYRIYGDGAETIGLNAFELLTMISVSTQHASTLKTRFVCLGFLMPNSL